MRGRLLEEAAVGLCLRSADGTVQFQNELCRSICGDTEGARCERACERGRARRPPDEGAELARGAPLRGRCCDVAVVEGEGSTIALLLPLTERIVKLRRSFEAMELTEREIDIAVQVAFGKSNAQIIKLTGLSKATVRTHLNHIHQKLPDAWLRKARLRRRR